MEPEDPLSQLADIHLPDPVSIWPLAPGWWVVIALLLALAGWLIFHAIQKIILNRRLLVAQHELTKAYQSYRETLEQENSDENQAGLDYLYAVNAVLNRVALYIDKSNSREIARLSGQSWLEYLDHCSSGSEFLDGPGKVLSEGQYRPIFAGEVEALYKLAQNWIDNLYRKQNLGKTDSSNTIKVAA